MPTLKQIALDTRDVAAGALKATAAQHGEAYQTFALSLAPAVAFAYAAGYELGSFIHRLNERLPRLLRFLGVAA